MITMSFRKELVSSDGFTAAECARQLADAGAEIVGTNCMRDPIHTYPVIEAMRAATDHYIAAQPVAYRTTDEIPWFTGSPAFPDRLEPTRLHRYDLGALLPAGTLEEAGQEERVALLDLARIAAHRSQRLTTPAGRSMPSLGSRCVADATIASPTRRR